MLGLEEAQELVAQGFYTQFLEYLNEEAGLSLISFPSKRKSDHVKLEVLWLNLAKDFLTS